MSTDIVMEIILLVSGIYLKSFLLKCIYFFTFIINIHESENIQLKQKSFKLLITNRNV